MMSKSESSITAVHIVDKMLTLSQQYNKYMNVFSEENISKLLSH